MSKLNFSILCFIFPVFIGFSQLAKPIDRSDYEARFQLITNRLSSPKAVPAFTEEFILADVNINPDSPRRFDNFSGDLSGRYIGAASIVPFASKMTNLDSLVSKLLTFQKRDGRFGNDKLVYSKDLIGDQHMALLWGNGRLLVGLMEYYMVKKDPKVLEAGKRLGDFYHATFKACADPAVRERLKGMGAFGFICFTQYIEGLALLGKFTNDPTYLKLASEVYPLLPERGDQHSHGYLTTLRGVLELFSVTKNKAQLEFVEKAYNDLINSDDYNVLGGVKEFFGPKPIEDRDEGCSEADFLRLSIYLYQLTQNPIYLNIAERSYYNAFNFNQYLSGDFGHHHFTVNGFRPDNNHQSWWCCTMHGLRALDDINKVAFEEVTNGLRVNLYVKGLAYSGKYGRIKIEPLSLKDNFYSAMLTIPSNAVKLKTLDLRIPDWAEEMKVTINGKKVGEKINSTYHIGMLNPGDKVLVAFKYKLSIQKDPREKNENVPNGESYMAHIYYGPHLMAVHKKVDKVFTAEPSWHNVLFASTLSPVDASVEPAIKANYKHQGFPGIYSTVLEPISEATWYEHDFLLYRFDVASGDLNKKVFINETNYK